MDLITPADNSASSDLPVDESFIFHGSDMAQTYTEKDLNLDSVIEQLISVRDNPGKQVCMPLPASVIHSGRFDLIIDVSGVCKLSCQLFFWLPV